MILDRVDYAEILSLGRSATVVTGSTFDGLRLNAQGQMCLSLKPSKDEQAILIEVQFLTLIEAFGLQLSPGTFKTEEARVAEIEVFLRAVAVFAQAEQGVGLLGRLFKRSLAH